MARISRLTPAGIPGRMHGDFSGRGPAAPPAPRGGYFWDAPVGHIRQVEAITIVLPDSWHVQAGDKVREFTEPIRLSLPLKLRAQARDRQWDRATWTAHQARMFSLLVEQLGLPPEALAGWLARRIGRYDRRPKG